MPRGDGTGPPGGGDPRAGRGRGIGRGGRGLGRMGGTRAGAGPAGSCICPNCGNSVPHQAGAPCYNISCPQCGVKMERG
jgi:hypothetical protein